MPSRFLGLVGQSDGMQDVYSDIRKFAEASIEVVIVGETGTGKEMCAQAIRQLYGPERPFVPMNCAATEPSLINSKLFGHVKGAFTGASSDREGLVAQADGGILFLDEIVKLSTDVQARLLRTMETGEYREVGGEETRTSRFRLLAASQIEPERLVERGDFRSDFHHRLGVVRIQMPPLRRRLEDVPGLARHFVDAYAEKSGRGRPTSISDGAVALLQRPSWPGNVRQLRHVVDASAAICEGDTISRDEVVEFLPSSESPAEAGDAPETLQESVHRAERRAIVRALKRTDDNKVRAAEILDISESTLHRKISRLWGEGPPFGSQS